MSLSLLGKAFYSNKVDRQAPKHSYQPLKNADLTLSYKTNHAIPVLAPHIDRKLGALISKKIELIHVEGDLISQVYKSPHHISYVPTAAQWQPMNSCLIVADQNGKIRLFDLQKGDLKHTQTSASVGRSIKSLHFNGEQPNVFCAAVSDGSVRCFDLRQSLQRSSVTLQRNGDVTRQCEFQPSSEFRLASIYDSGVVQIWDIRQRTRELRINAHQQGLSLNWHPVHYRHLATGGRDHLVQVWNTGLPSEATLTPELLMQVPHSVSSVKWALDDIEEVQKTRIVCVGRPIESYSMRSTYSVYSFNEPYVPKYTVEQHTDGVTNVYPLNSQLIWSTGLDGKFVQTDLRYETPVRASFPKAVVDMPPWDMAAVAFAPKVDEMRSMAIPFRRPSHVTPHLTPYGTPHQFSPGSGGGYFTPMDVGSPNSTSTTPLSHSSSSTNVHAAAVTAANQLAANSCNPAAAANATLQVPHELKYVLEIGLPYEDGESLRAVAEYMTFIREHKQTHAEACRSNAKVMRQASRYKYAEIWSSLAVACETIESDFLQTLSGDQRELCVKWFDGQVNEQFEVRSSAIDFKEFFDVYDENEFGSSFPRRSSSFSSRRKQISVSSQRPSVQLEKDPFLKLKEDFFAFSLQQTNRWQFWPMLKHVIGVHLTNGYYTGAMALLVLFRALPQLYEVFDVPDIIRGGLQTLERYGSFVPAALIRNILRQEAENSEIYSTLVSSEPNLEQPDTVCHRCFSSLSDNAAFYARNDDVVGYWYCFKCKLVLDGCCLCDRQIIGLCKVITECGHRMHTECFDQWVYGEYNVECPSGCGQKISL